MSRPPRSERTHGVDRDGELYTSPTRLNWVWAVLIILMGLEAANELFGIGGPTSLYELWFHDAVVAAAAVLILARAVYEPAMRRAWLAFGSAMALWSAGTIAWSLVYGSQVNPPYPTFADILWLLWYPFMAVGIICLIRVRVARFELHRWMDGLAVTLVVLAGGFALVIQPLADQARTGTLATVVNFSYPVLDVVIMGSIVGVYSLLGWRPDRMWILIGSGILMTTIADAAFAVQEARGVANDGTYDFVWTLGAILIAYAAWVRAPAGSAEVERQTGLRAVALPLVAQAMAAGIQIYALFEPIGKSERIGTVAVLVVSSVQIILTRPRSHDANDAGSQPEVGHTLDENGEPRVQELSEGP
ncbi:MAG: diguanylate cyclase [Acidimicrobiaceae bacterium]|nr:diguanylate cyclase [Acidimicrobiaceae bacterium]